MVTCKRPILYTTDHDARTFCAQLPFRTGLGHTDGDAWRRNLRAPGGGPYRVFTPLGVLDFETEDGRARLRAVNPGVTVAQVVEATGFELAIAPDVGETEPPTAEELRVLREVVDPLGVRQTEFRTMRAEANRRIEAARLERS
jgi:glutaconate CoA-transferase subunit B